MTFEEFDAEYLKSTPDRRRALFERITSSASNVVDPNEDQMLEDALHQAATYGEGSE